MRGPGTKVPISGGSTVNDCQFPVSAICLPLSYYSFLLFHYIIILLCTFILRPALGGKGPLRGPMASSRMRILIQKKKNVFLKTKTSTEACTVFRHLKPLLRLRLRLQQLVQHGSLRFCDFGVTTAVANIATVDFFGPAFVLHSRFLGPR